MTTIMVLAFDVPPCQPKIGIHSTTHGTDVYYHYYYVLVLGTPLLHRIGLDDEKEIVSIYI